MCVRMIITVFIVNVHEPLERVFLGIKVLSSLVLNAVHLSGSDFSYLEQAWGFPGLELTCTCRIG